MFNTKIEVDRHVENCLKKLNNDFERNLRCCAFAKLYYKVGDYEQARRYISMYLNVKPVSAEAQQLLGAALEKLGKKEQALEAYRTSLDLDPKQNSLVIKICELLASDDVYFDQCGARYYCEKAQAFDPLNPAVFTLKEKLVATESRDPNDVTRLIVKELETRPADVDIRIRLLRHLLQHNQVKEAYKHAQEIEQQNLPLFLGNLSWYETIAEVLIKYQRDTTLSKNLNWQFWVLLISVLDKVVSLSLDERSINIKNSSEYIISVFNFDQTLKLASENVADCPEKKYIQEFLSHYRGQLCLHLATLVFKQAKKDLIQYKDAINLTLPLLFAAYNTPPADLQCIWLDHAQESFKKQVQRWHKEAAYRCSQAGHILLAAAKDRKTTIIEKATRGCSGMWREQQFKKLFVTRDQQAQIKSSFFTTSNDLVDIPIRLPDLPSLIKYDETAQLIYSDSLHHYIWIGLNQKLSHFNCSVFEGLPYSIKNLNNCAAESLNVLDIQSFLYCAVLCAQSKADENKSSYYINPHKPIVLPAAITDNLGTINQSKWLTAAYKMYKNEYSCNFSELRLTLIRGIEVVRCVGNHGLDVKLLITLANTFSERAKVLEKHSEIEYNDARAEMYWKAALPLLDKLRNNQAVFYPSNRLFEYKSKELNMNEIAHHIDCGKLFNAVQLMKKKENEKALKLFEHLKDPYASFYQAQIYKSMADEQTNQSKENLTSEMRSQNIILLSKAKDYFYLTLDRLRDPSVDRHHPLNNLLGTEIEKIERLLSRIDPDLSTNRNECDGMSDENTSSMGSLPEHIGGASFSIQNQSYLNGTSPRQDIHAVHTPYRLEASFRREARPSPERLDAQLRQLAASKDATISNILEQNRLMVDSHRSLVDELRSFKDAVTTLTSSVNDLKTMKHRVEDLKHSVDDLKVAVDDLQSFRNVQDMVYEMKKEISEMRKDSSKKATTQLSDEDLYVLGEEYGAAADFNINSNTVQGLNASLYPNFPGRLPSATNLGYPPPALYPGMYPMYPYAGLGFAPPGGGLPFADPQIPDFRFPPALNQAVQQQNFAQAALSQAALQQPSLAAGPALFAQSPAGLAAANILSGQGTVSQQSLYKEPSPNASSIPVTQVLGMPSFSSTNTTLPTTTVASGKALPLNVVITASDPLPTIKTTVAQPILSVTIPPQHLKGNQHKPHNYQIPLPTTSSVTNQNLPSVMNQSPLPVSTHTLLSNIAPPIYSSISDKTSSKNVGLGIQIEKSLSQSFNTSKNDSKFDISTKSNASTVSLEEHDPCPDFKPIIPLPDEVTISTGEENETILFCERARLYRYTNKEWKERGVGNLKILKNNDTGKIRILMRRDQVHKVCANHFITKDMELNPMPQSETAFIWAAHDYSDQKCVLEKLCAKFKTAAEAQKFKSVFKTAQKEIPDETPKKPEESKPAVSIVPNNLFGVKPEAKPIDKAAPVASFGGFVFTSTPTFKPKDDTPVTPKAVVQSEPTKTSPFASFSFGPKASSTTTPSIFSNILPKKDDTPVTSTVTSTTTLSKQEDDSHVEEFVPNVDFKPVVPLPDLVEVKTGEENCEVLFEHKAKLLRYDTTAKEWKERGIGQMKILKDHIIRFVMRREQVLKVCCNHQLLKEMNFTKMEKNPKMVTWCAKDFSENELTDNIFGIRFKTEDITNSFLEAIKNAKSLLDDNNQVRDKAAKETTEKKSSDKKSKSEPVQTAADTSPVSSKSGWGDKFKPRAGSWECKNCYVANDGKSNYCVACETPKNDTVPKKTTDSDSSGPQFSFGIAKSPAQTNLFGAKADSTTTSSSSFVFGQKTTTTTSGWGDAFKPKAGSWECKECYTRNEGDKLYCLSCEGPRDESVPKKDTSKGISLDTGGLTFSFGIPANKPATVPTTTSSDAKTFNFGTPSQTTAPTDFIFGAAKTTELAPKTEDPINLSSGKATFTFKLNMPVEETGTVEATEKKDQFVFGSPQTHKFEFTPRSPRRHSGGNHDEESDGSYVEEEADTIYFKPVIPLPDKVEVKTGEEQETALYCHRAKLFRFVQGEWKERGIGDLKILLTAETGKLRVLMRREKILKICLNHTLTPDIEYMPKDDKTWLFSAPDFSEGEISQENFCLRFKTAEIAQEFKTAVDEALKTYKGTPQTTPRKQDTPDSEVEIVYESKVTKEEEEEAKRLMLPEKFMAYRQLPDCTCDQCKREDELLKELFEGKTSASSMNKQVTSPLIKPSSFDTSGSTLFGTPTNQTSQSGGTSFFGTPSSTFSFNTPTSSNNSVLKDLLTKPSANTTPVIKPPSNIFGGGDASTIETPTKPTSEAAKKFSFTLKTEESQTTTPAKEVFTTASTEAKAFSFTAQPNQSLFSSPSTQTPVSGGSLFGAANASLFGSSTTTGNIFGGGATIGGAVFGTNKPNTSIFGGANLAQPLFGASSVNTSTPSFGSLAQGQENTSTPSFGSLAQGQENTSTPSFGSLAQGQENTSMPSFGLLAQGQENTSMPSFGSLAQGQKKEEPEKDAPSILPVDNSLSFASLAATTTKDALPAFAAKTDVNPFAHLGAGAPVFKTAKPAGETKKDKTGSDDEADDEGATGEEYDPHYEPIVPLPDAIVVSTGEEDEVAMFNERGKVYRYDDDNKEWKERGVGQLKLLHHPQKGTYRLLLRREQVHKVVLNMLITSQLDLQPMSLSDRAWLWVGSNFIENECHIEKLAARFTKPEIAHRFQEVVQKAVEALKKQQEFKEQPATIPSLVENYGTEDPDDGGDNENVEEEEEGDYDEGDYDDDDDTDERSIMFANRCQYSVWTPEEEWKSIADPGEIRVYYDPDLYGSSILVSDETGLLISKTIIGMNTVMNIEGDTCTWRAVECANDVFEWRNMRATFPSVDFAQEFHLSYVEGVQYAEQCDLVDEIPVPETDERES